MAEFDQAVEKAKTDLERGLNAHTLEDVIHDMVDFRKKDPAGFAKFVKAMDESAHHDPWSPLSEAVHIVDLDSSGTKLVATSVESDRSVEVDADGLSTLVPQSKYAKPVSPDELGGPENFGSPGLQAFNPVMLAGLETHNAHLETAWRSEKVVNNPDGTVTHKYSGQLKDAFTLKKEGKGIFDHHPNTDFTGEMTTTAGGKVLSTSLNYGPVRHSWIDWTGLHSENADKGVLGLGSLDGFDGINVAKRHFETHFNPLTRTYVTKIEGRLFSEEDKNGERLPIHGTYIPAAKDTPSTVNDHGKVTEIFYNTNYTHSESENWPKATFQYDSNDSLVSMTDRTGAKWTKIGSDEQTHRDVWQVDTGTTKSTWRGTMYVDDLGQIIRKTDQGTEIVTPKGNTERFDKHGDETGELDAGTEDIYSYTLNEKGEPVQLKVQHSNGDSDVYEHQKAPFKLYSDARPMVLLR